MALTKVTGDFIKAGSITQGHLHSSHGITTSHIAEGDKLFFTNARVDSRVGSLSTSNLSEGTNLYYTDARARGAISATGSLSYNNTTGVMSFTMPAQNTSNITEGSNLYYTDARADARIAAADTGDLSEGTNLYYTQARFNTAFAAKSTSNLSEGTNLYYTDARADARVALIVDSAPGTLNTLNELAAALGDDANFSTTVTNSIATKLPLAGGALTGTLTCNNVGNDKKIAFRRTGSNNFSIEHDSAFIYFYNETTSSVVFKMANNNNTTFTGDIVAPGIYVGSANTSYDFYNNGTSYFNGTSTFDDNILIPSASHDLHIGNNLSTTGKVRFGLSSWNNSLGLESYWMVLRTNQNEGLKLIDSAGNTYAQFNASNNSSGAYNTILTGNLYVNALYDQNNTAYYVNPASRSNFGDLDLNSGAVWDATTQGTAKGALHLDPNSGTDHAGGAITFGASDHNNGQSSDAGIYVRSDGSYGTKMYFSTTDSYATGSKTAMNILQNGQVNITRSNLIVNTDVRAPLFYDSNNTSYYVDPNGTSNVYKIQSGSKQASPRWDTAFYVLQAQHWYGDTSSQEMIIGESGNIINLRGILDLNGGHGALNLSNSSILSSASSTWTGNPGANGKIQYHSNRWYIVSDSSSDMIVQFRRDGSDVSYIDNAGRLIGAPDARAPIYYDSDNTGYYVNPATGSNLYAPITFQTNDSTLTFQDAGTNAFQMKMGAGDELYLGSNNNYQLQMTTSGNVNTQGDWRFGANFVKVGNSSTYNSDDGNWGSRFVVSSTVHARIDVAQDANAVRASWLTHTGQLYSTFGTVTGHDMRLISHNARRQTLYNGYSEEEGSYRAPIFYDSNDTSFYLNPAVQSRLGSLKLDGIISGTTSGCAEYGRNHAYHTPEIKGYGAEFMIGAQHTEININYRTCNNGASGHTPTIWKWRAGASNNWSDHYMGLIQSSSSMRAPIFYDSNDTSYYVNPAGLSDFHQIKTTSSVDIAPRWDTSFYVAQSQHYYGHTSTQTMYLGEANHINIRNIADIHGQARAPIYYDRNNTGYYMDPHSTSNVNAITLAGTFIGQNAYFAQDVGIGFTSGNIGGRLNVKNSAAGQIAGKFQLGGSVNSSSTGVFVNTTASYASSGMFLHFQSNHISGDDNVLIAYLDGDIVNKNNSYTQYSDQRLKENIVDATSKLDEIKQIRVRNFNFIGEDLKQIGVVAQELEPIFPALVKEREVPGHEDPIKTVKYSVMVPILIKAMQEQQTIIDDLKSRLETLENQ